METHGEMPRSDESEVRTFLVADVRGYTSFTLTHGDEAAARLAEQFMRVSREVIGAGGGTIFSQAGDQVLAVFTSARRAVRAAVDLQTRLAAERASGRIPALSVGAGLDAGEAVPLHDNYFGTAVNLAARLCSLAGPGEVLVSETVTQLTRKLDGLTYRDRGTAELKGFSAPVNVSQVVLTGEGGAAEPAGTAEVAAGRTGARDLPIGNFLGALPEGIMVARDAETARLHEFLGAAEAGGGRLALLAGEPGVGKTRLAQEIMLEARNRGFIVAAGRCYEQEGGVPYYPFLDALAMLYAAAPREARAEVPRRWAQLARLLPDEQLAPPPSSESGAEEQHKLFRAVAAFVAAVAERRPVALFLDDLHWADASSLQLFQHLVRSTRADRVLIVGTYRDVEVSRRHPLQATVRDLHREGLVERLDVHRLEAAGTEKLICATVGTPALDPSFVDLLYRRTEGNPFFVHEVLRVVRTRQGGESRWSPEALAEIEVPESVRAVIEQRLAPLPEETQELLREASVLGQSFSFRDLLAVAGRPEAEVERGLEEAAALGIVREGRGDEYAFNHALTQGTLYGELLTRRRRRLHLAAGEALSAQPEAKRRERAAELAWHFLEGDDPERALPALLLAGDGAESIFAHAEAERHFRTAVDVSEDTGDRAQRAEALEKLGRVLRTVGRVEEATGYLRDALAEYERIEELDGQGRTLTQLLIIRGMQGGGDEILEQARAVIERLESRGPSPTLVALYSEYGQPALMHRMSEETATLAQEKASAMARELGDSTLIVAAETRRAMSLVLARHTGEGLAVLEELLPLAEESLTYYGTYAIGMYGEMLKLSGQLDRALALRWRHVHRAEMIGEAAQIVASLGMLGEILFLTGDWTEARVHLQRAVELGEPLQSPHYLGFAVLPLAELEIATGAWDDAEARLEALARDARESGHTNRLQQGARIRARLDLERGRPDLALRRLDTVWWTDADEDPAMLLARAAAMLDTGSEGEAERMVEHVIELTTEQGNRLDACEAYLLRGQALTRADRPDDAARAFEEALSLARAFPYPFAEGHALLGLGQIHGPGVDVAEQQRPIEEAGAIFERLGATPWIARAQAALGVDRREG